MKPALKKIPVKVYMPEDFKLRFRSAASSRYMDLSTWIIQACLAYAKNNESFGKRNALKQVWPSGWPKDSKCPVCMKLDHDPASEHVEWTSENDFWLTLADDLKVKPNGSNRKG